MIQSLVYLVLAAFGLGFLVFIHELGHYFMARRLGMKVEAFGIGFGKPIRRWEHNGVKWNLCWLPFGGYVKIAGMEKEGALEPHQISGGFFSKSPWDRIKVLAMGPLVNIVFAFIAFTAIWALGGREKNFSEFTHRIGWIDPDSHLYEQGVRPGDLITQLDGKPFKNFNDLIYAAILEDKPQTLQGLELDYWTKKTQPFASNLDPNSDLKGINTKARVMGILAPATYLQFEGAAAHSPMGESGIQKGDRILWVDGALVFSQPQMTTLINEPKALLTIQRKDKVFLTRVPRLKVEDLRIGAAEKAELDDWQHESGLMKSKIEEVYFIPYNVDNFAVVERPFSYMGEDSEEHIYEGESRTNFDIPLRQGDKILAVDGIPISSSYELMGHLQERHIQVIVQRENEFPSLSWKDADANFDSSIDWAALQKMILSIGTSNRITQAGDLFLLNPITPKPFSYYASAPEKREWYEERIREQQKRIEAIQNPKARALAQQEFEAEQRELRLGIFLADRKVNYNPPPTTLFSDVFKDTGRTLFALITGYLNPKWLQGPVGIVQVMQYGWSLGIKEALYWMGMISLNLGLLNLLPIPLLDGGYICFSVVEIIRGKPLKARTMEKLVIPFIILLIGFFLYVTYNDLSRLFYRFF